MNERGWTCTYPNTSQWDVWSRTSLNSNIKSRPKKCQVQNVYDDKAANVAIHLDSDHQPRDKSIITQNNYNTFRLDRAHAIMVRQAYFFCFF